MAKSKYRRAKDIFTICANIRGRVADVLNESGYPDYALALNGFAGVYEFPPEVGLVGATDFENLFLKANLTDEELSLVARHEILHVLLNHNKRIGRSRKPRTWNSAADFELSNYYTAHDDAVIEASDTLRDGCTVTTTPAFQGLVAEEIYDRIMEARKQAQEEREKAEQLKQNAQEQDAGDQESLPMGGAGSGGQGGQGGQDQTPQDADESGQDGDQQEDDQEDGEQSEGGESGQDESDGDQQEDAQEDGEEDEDEEEADGNGSEEEKEETGAGDEEDEEDEEETEEALTDEELQEVFDEMMADLSEDEKDSLRNSLIEAVQEAFDEMTPEQQAQMMGRPSPVMDSAEIKEKICQNNDNANGSEKPVRELPKAAETKLTYNLRRYFIKQENVEKVRSFRRPNKKYSGSNIIVKGRCNKYKESKTLAVYIDISGSMNKEMLRKAIGCCESIEDIKRTTVIKKYFNDEVYDDFRPGGGTNYNAVFRDAQENGYDCIAVITDDTGLVPVGNFDFEAIWLIGIEESRSDRPVGDYSFASRVNAPGHSVQNARINAKHFEINIVPWNR